MFFFFTSGSSSYEAPYRTLAEVFKVTCCRQNVLVDPPRTNQCFFILENANITTKRQRLREEVQEKEDTIQRKKPLKHDKGRRRERKNNDSVRTVMTPGKKQTKRNKQTNSELVPNKKHN